MTGVGIPIACLLAGAALPVAYDLKGSVGELKGSLGGISQQVATSQKDIERDIQNARTEIDRRMDGIEKKMDRSIEQVGSLIIRTREIETDPSTVLVRHGIAPDTAYGFAWVEGKAYLFPKTPDAEVRLLQAGYKKEQLSPVLYGYVSIVSNVPIPR